MCEQGHARLAEQMIERLHARAGRQLTIGDDKVEAMHRQFAEQVIEIVLPAHEADVFAQVEGRLQDP